MIRRLRIATGLILFAYVAFHLLNVSLGLFSISLMDRARPFMTELFRSPPGAVLLMAAFGIHGALGLHALFWRNTLRMTRLDLVQLVSSLCIVPLLLPHVVGTALAAKLYYYDPSFRSLLGLFWVDSPAEGLRQVLTLVFVWVHGTIGLFTWMRLQRWWPRVSGVLYPLAVAIPVMALLGFAHAGKELTAPVPAAEDSASPGDAASAPAMSGDEEAAPAAEESGAAAPDEGAPAAAEAPGDAAHQPPTGAALVAAAKNLDHIKWTGIAVFAALLAATLAARAIRVGMHRGKARVSWVDGPEILVEAGPTLLELANQSHLPHAKLCRGRGRCGTCRVRILMSDHALPPPGDQEALTLARIGAEEGVRLACQLVPPPGTLRVERLLQPDVRPADLRRQRQEALARRAAQIVEAAE